MKKARAEAVRALNAVFPSGQITRAALRSAICSAV